MAASTSQAYRETDGPKSPNVTPVSPFSLLGLIEGSALLHRHKRLLKAMLSKNRFGSELWISTERLQVIIGPICSRRKNGQDTRGRILSACERIHRRTVQRTIDEAVAAGVIEQVLEPNVWVGHGKHRKFRRSATYALRAERLGRQKTWEEYYAEKPHPKSASHRSSARSSERSSEQSSPLPAQEPSSATSSAAPAPVRETPPPAAHESRPEQRMRERRQRLTAVMVQQMRAGASREDALKIAAAASGFSYAEADEQLKLMHFDPGVLLEGNVDATIRAGDSASSPRSERAKRNILNGLASEISRRDAPDSLKREDGT